MSSSLAGVIGRTYRSFFGDDPDPSPPKVTREPPSPPRRAGWRWRSPGRLALGLWAAAIACVLVSASFAFVTLPTARRQASTALALQGQVGAFQLLVRGEANNERDYLLSGDQQFLIEFATKQADAEAQLTSVMAKKSFQGRAELVGGISTYRAFLADHAAVVAIFASGRKAEAIALAIGTERQNREIAEGFFAASNVAVVDAARSNEAHATRLSNLASLLLVGLGAGLVATAVETARRLKRQRATAERLRQSEQHFRAVVDHVPAAVYSLTPDGVVTAWNPAATAIFGWTEAEAVGHTLPFLAPDRLDEFAANRAETAAGVLQLSTWETICLRRDGTSLDVSVSTAPIRDVDGRVDGIIGVIADITDSKRAAAEAASVHRRDQQLAAIVSSSADAIISRSLDGRVVSWNAGAEAMFGYPVSEAIGQPMSILARPDDLAARMSLVDSVIAGRPVVGYESVMVRKDGTEITVAITASPLFEGNDIVGHSAVMRDISPQKALEASLERRALYDELTGLPNRVLFVDRLDSAISRVGRRGDLVAVLFVTINHSKVVNDGGGHQGDRLLAQMAERLAGALRPGDTVARFGGNEFAMLCEGVSGEAEAVAIADRLQQLAAPSVRLDGREDEVTVSTGIALTASPDALAAVLLQDAGSAMYKAKDAGRSCSLIFVESMRTRADRHHNAELALSQAVAERQLRLHYQPIVDLTTGRTEGVEALVRWQHPTDGLIVPNSFIPLAEETGLVVPLGAWVLAEACRQCQSWHRAHPQLEHLTVSVKLSGRQIAQADIVAVVADALTRSGLPANSLVLEITQNLLMNDAPDTVTVLTALKGLGVRLSVDHFGTGYSSLSYLNKFPLDLIKIDKSFVDGLVEHDDQDTGIVAATINLAHSLGLMTIAEGTETTHQADVLARLGCDSAQGYLFSRPQPAAIVIQSLLQVFPTSEATPSSSPSGLTGTIGRGGPGPEPTHRR